MAEAGNNKFALSGNSLRPVLLSRGYGARRKAINDGLNAYKQPPIPNECEPSDLTVDLV